MSGEFSAVPAALRDRDSWVCFKLEPYTANDGTEKTDKIPYRPHNPRRKAKSSVPDTWADFDTALDAYRSVDDLDGLGFMFDGGDTLAAVDFDHVRRVDPDTGDVDVSQWAGEAIAQLDSYTEISPSGTGFHTWIFGLKPGDSNKTEVENGEDIEMYDHSDNRFLTVTGDRVAEPPATVEQRNGVFGDLYRQYFDVEPETGDTNPTPKPGDPPSSADLEDSEVLERARNADNGDRFQALERGDDSNHGGDTSRADLAFMNQLSFWAGGDRQQMARLFRRSNRGDRDKADRDDYIKRTIDTALSGTTDYYDPDHNTAEASTDTTDARNSALRQLGEAGDLDPVERAEAETEAIEDYVEAVKQAGLDKHDVGPQVTALANEATNYTITGIKDLIGEREAEDPDRRTFDVFLEEELRRVEEYVPVDMGKSRSFVWVFDSFRVETGGAKGNTHNNWFHFRAAVDACSPVSVKMPLKPPEHIADGEAWLSWIDNLKRERHDGITEVSEGRALAAEDIADKIARSHRQPEDMDITAFGGVLAIGDLDDPTEIHVDSATISGICERNGISARGLSVELNARGWGRKHERGFTVDHWRDGAKRRFWAFDADKVPEPLEYVEEPNQQDPGMSTSQQNTREDRLFGDGPGDMRTLTDE